MNDAALLERMWESMRSLFARFARGSEGGRLVEHDGALALVTPAVPERSVLNSVLYRDADGLVAALPELAQTYDDAGVTAWTVWAHPGDAAATGVLERSGHRLDATPAAMGRELDTVTAHMPPEAEWTRDADLGELLRVNDEAYGWADTRPWTRALSRLPPEEVHRYLLSVDGRPACGLLTHEHAGDCSVWLVATLAAARGRGLAAALLGQALVDARARGCSTTTLQATRLGEPVYARLDYRTLGRLEMWERRKQS